MANNIFKFIVACYIFLGINHANETINNFLNQQLIAPYTSEQSRNFICSNLIIPFYINNTIDPNTLIIKCANYINNADNIKDLFSYLTDTSNFTNTEENIEELKKENYENDNTNISQF